MPHLDLILTLAGGFTAALLLGYLMLRLGWSPIVGYLLAGVLIGPHTPGFVANEALASELAEVGVILLMFGVGLHFHLQDLLAVKGIAIAGAVLQSLAATLAGAALFHFLGAGWSTGIVLGLALSVASTVVLIRLLSERGLLHSPTGRIAVGWLVMEDIITVLVLVMLPAAFHANQSLPISFGIATLKLVAFTGFTLTLGAKFVPWLLNRIAETRSRELFTLGVLSLVLGIAVGATLLFGVSLALGAFLAGMVVGQSEFSARAGADALPLRDAFAVMFFVSIGSLLNPGAALASPGLTLAALVIVLIAKPVAALAIVAVLGYSSRIGWAVALALAQVGEFSFLLATVGRQVGALDETASNAVVFAAILSIMINPVLFRLAEPAEAWLDRNPRLWRWMNRREGRTGGFVAEQPAKVAYHAVVVGHGPIGQMVTRILDRRGIASTIIEMNLDTYRRLSAAGRPVIYGDANRAEVLEQAGVERASSLILSASGATVAAAEAVRIARERNPHIHVVARADYVGETEALRRAGADEVFSGEGEVALAMADSILQHLGATPDQLDEAREQIREKLFRVIA